MPNGDYELNQKKLAQMKIEILETERKNLKTREKSSDAIIDTIRKIIVTEIKKNF